MDHGSIVSTDTLSLSLKWSNSEPNQKVFKCGLGFVYGLALIYFLRFGFQGNCEMEVREEEKQSINVCIYLLCTYLILYFSIGVFFLVSCDVTSNLCCIK